MGKAKTKKHGEAKQMHGIKNGFVKKNKDSKFKNTTMGCKMALIKNSDKQDRDSSFNKDSVNTKNNRKLKPLFNNSKQASKSPQQSKQNSPKEKQNSPNNRQKHKFTKKTPDSHESDSDEFDLDESDFDIEDGVTPQVDASSNETEISEEDSDIDEGVTSQVGASSNETETSEEDSDIDEGVTPQVNASSSETETSEEDSDSDVPDILGKSLGDESDEDDEDFEEEYDSDKEEAVERKGIKMFNGLQSETKRNDGKKDPEEEDDDESESFDDWNMTSDKSDESDEDEEVDNHRKQIQYLDKSLMEELSRGWGDSTDSDDNNDSSDSSDDSIDTEFGTKKLFEECTAEVCDDKENHNGVTKYTVTKKTAGKASYRNDEAIEEMDIYKKLKKYKEKRTVLVNNVPRTTDILDVARPFIQYGVIRKIQLRILPEMNIISKKMAVSLGIPLDYPNLKTYVAYIEFEKEGSAEAAAEALNGIRTAEGNFLNVLTARQVKGGFNPKKTVFFGNFKPGLDPENDLWELFITCGRIRHLNVYRDYDTGLTKGHGYVYMDTEAAARTIVRTFNKIAKIGGQPLHLKLMLDYIRPGSSNKNDDKVMKQGTKRASPHSDKKSSKKFKTDSEKPVASNVEQKTTNKKKKQQGNNKGATSAAFQGQKVELKNKKKKNRLDKKKKKMAGKLTAKSAKA
ncbi:PREDICTED: nucleolin 2-like [Wasmannia auropunctata]|uniref:nucleolin 2-like n=1 Tax=Wasmannia auropunctata TaxID=64793 RepID=UPI0005ED7D30|nr:PREDICTED: nucleolin 2-like [Wasmannia auropunctata]